MAASPPWVTNSSVIRALVTEVTKPVQSQWKGPGPMSDEMARLEGTSGAWKITARVLSCQTFKKKTPAESSLQDYSPVLEITPAHKSGDAIGLSVSTVGLPPEGIRVGDQIEATTANYSSGLTIVKILSPQK